MVKPSQRREMAQRAVSERTVSIRLACLIFSISETCYRYQAKLCHENAEIADWLIRLTHNHRNWGFVLIDDFCVVGFVAKRVKIVECLVGSCKRNAVCALVVGVEDCRNAVFGYGLMEGVEAEFGVHPDAKPP